MKNHDNKLDLLKRCVAGSCGIHAEDILSNNRTVKVARARQVVLYMARTRLTMPIQDIARAFDISPATIVHSVNLISKRVESDANLWHDIEEISRRLDADARLKSSPQAETCEPEDAHWQRVVVFLQEAGTVIDYLLRRVYAKQAGEELSEPVLYAVLADDDGELTCERIVLYLEAMARQARAGFVDGPGFPVFGSMEWSKNGGTNA